MQSVASYCSRSCHAYTACTPRASAWVISLQIPFGSLLTGQSCSHRFCLHDTGCPVLLIGLVLLTQYDDVGSLLHISKHFPFWSTRLVILEVATHAAMAASSLCSSQGSLACNGTVFCSITPPYTIHHGHSTKQLSCIVERAYHVANAGHLGLSVLHKCHCTAKAMLSSAVGAL